MNTTIKFSFNGIITLLILLMALQSCNVYKPETYSLKDASDIGKTVKIKTVNDKSFFFQKLAIENNELFGYAKKNSKAAKHFKDQIIRYQKEIALYKIALDKNDIKEIKVKDTTASLVVSIVITAVIIGGVIAFASGAGGSISPTIPL